MSKFHPEWVPTLISEEIVASGVWWYEDTVECSVQLIRRTYDYTSFDIPILEEILNGADFDDLEYNISDQGVLYFWRIQGPSGQTYSPCFSTYFTAREHIDSYSGKNEIDW